jgi:cytochrome c oxidase accessory protein FixG
MPTRVSARPTREAVTTIRTDGSRPFIHAADTRGRFTSVRRVAALALIAFYFSLPWVKINGYPAAFFDVAQRRFHLFGLTLAAQDLWLLFFVITGVGFSLFFVTALLGRIWCGWACPHTVFLDQVYRRIERLIDGDAIERRQLSAAPASLTKIGKRLTKHLLYVAVSAAITHLFLAYFVSIPEVWAMMRVAPAQHWEAFAFIAIATAALYFNFAWFREQMCIVLCPYGRMQSALIDSDSLVIGYDARRGEPRGKAGIALGSCVDCSRCVQVCPTGIDIRQGLQMECVGCTACIDACDDVMSRLGRPRGLIRYDSQAAFAGRTTRWVRARTVLYFFLLMVGIAVATWALSTVKPATGGVTRMTGAPYIVDGTSIRNQFLVRIVNKRNSTTRFTVRVEGAGPEIHQVGFDGPIEIAALQEIVQPLVVQQPRPAYRGPFRLRIHIEDTAGSFTIEKQVEFVGPDARLLREEEAERHDHS